MDKYDKSFLVAFSEINFRNNIFVGKKFIIEILLTFDTLLDWKVSYLIVLSGRKYFVKFSITKYKG